MAHLLFFAAVSVVGVDALAAAPGTHTVASWDTVIDGGEAGPVWFKIHYPAVADTYGADADSSGGPFPVVGFMHGYLGAAWMYAGAADHLASMGAVVINLDIETGGSINTTRMAQGLQSSLWWVDDNSRDPEHWLHGMSDHGNWVVGAHSMGGVALAELVGLEPRVQTVIGYMPYEPSGEQWRPYESFEGTALMLAGSEDETSTSPMVELWHERLSAADRSLYFNLEHVGHQAISDFEWGTETMDDGAQQELVLSLSADLLQATWEVDDRHFQGLLCELSSPADPHRSMSHRPVTVAEPGDASGVRLSVAGLPDTEVVFFAGRGPDTTDTELGPIDLREAVELGRLSLDDGIGCLELALPESLAGTAWVQAAHVSDEGVTLGAAIDVFGVGDPGASDSGDGDGDTAGEGDTTDDDGTGGSDEGDDVDPGGASDSHSDDLDGGAGDPSAHPSTSTGSRSTGDKSGCTTVSSGASAFWLGLLALAFRRSSSASGPESGEPAPSAGMR